MRRLFAASVLSLALVVPTSAEGKIRALQKWEARQIVEKRIWNYASSSGKWTNWGVGRCRRDSRIQVRCRAWFIPMNPVLKKRFCTKSYRVRAVSDRRYSLAVWPKYCRPLKA